MGKPIQPIQASTLESTVLSPTSANHWSISLQTVLDQPPATLPLRLMVGGMLFCLAFGAWAWLGQIEEVGHAQGKLVPLGEPYKIHPTIPGKIADITVQEGQTVEAGQVLMELDNQIAMNAVEQLQQERTAYQTQWQQTQALIDKTRLEAQTHAVMADAKVQATEVAIAQTKAKIQAQTAAIAKAQEKVATTQEMLSYLRIEANAYRERREKLQPITDFARKQSSQLQANVAAQQARLERLKPLVEEGALSRERLFDIEQTLRDRQIALTQNQLQETTTIKEQLFEAEQNLHRATGAIAQMKGELQQSLADSTRTQAELKQVAAELNRLEVEQNQNRAQKRATQLENQQKIQQLEIQKTQLQAKIDETEKLLAKAKTELKQLTFTAPVNGVVLSLNVNNPGEVIQPGQTVAEISPHNAPLILLAKLPNREAGFIQTGMPVKIKMDAYPYQDYGIVSGQVRSISPDTKLDERLGSVYLVEIILDQNSPPENHQTISFKAGQTATADIIIRRRRIIDVLLDPIRQMQKSGLNL